MKKEVKDYYQTEMSDPKKMIDEAVIEIEVIIYLTSFCNNLDINRVGLLLSQYRMTVGVQYYIVF